MPKTLIKFSNITKRLASRNAISKSNIINECNSIEKSYRTINNILENNKSSGLSAIKLNADKILESLVDSNIANKYKFYPLSIAEKVNEFDNTFSDSVIDKYCTIILPYVDDMNSIIEGVNDFNLTDKQKERVLKEANIYNTCDRILNNHNTISKRFNLEDIVLKNKYNLQLAVESVCSMINTYNREAYQKMNICLEEMFYIIEKNNIPCKKADIINSIVEYFLLDSSTLSDANIKGFRKCINESNIISEDEAQAVLYINTNTTDSDNSNIKSIIADYYTISEKTPELFVNVIKRCMESDVIDITYNFNSILEFIFVVYKHDVLSDSELEMCMNFIESIISSRLVSIINDAELNKDDLSSILLVMISKIKEAESVISSYSRLYDYIKHIKNILSIVSPYYDSLYSTDNINVINTLESCTTYIPVSEGVLWKSHNLLTAIRNLDRYLGAKCKQAVHKLLGKAKKNEEPTIRDKISNLLFNDNYGKEGSLFDKRVDKTKKGLSNALNTLSGLLNIHKESYNPYAYISEESNMFDMTICRIDFEDEELSDLHDEIADVCKEFNYILETTSDTRNCKVYYLINCNEISIHLTENAKYILTDDDKKLIRESSHPDYDYCIQKLSEASAIAEFIDSINNKDLENSLFSYFSNNHDMSLEKFDTILEALSIIGIDKSIVSKFADKYTDHKYYSLSEDIDLESESKQVSSLVESYEIYTEASNIDKIEAYLLVDALLETYTDEDFEDDDEDHDVNDKKYAKSKYYLAPGEKDDSEDSNDDKEKSEDKEEIKKNPFKGINLKSLKLCILGLKSKFSKMSQKEKEISKNVDNSFKHLVDSFKNTMISNSRESVIKGSVIPSFSRCLKTGLVAAVGIGSGILNPGVAAIAALGSFAISKNLTKKERILLLDEIETELDVVEKEISMAEREEDMKRYRALLQYKKNLQRQYQRIRYNVKLGKDLLPGSNAGISGDHQNGY